MAYTVEDDKDRAWKGKYVDVQIAYTGYEIVPEEGTVKITDVKIKLFSNFHIQDAE